MDEGCPTCLPAAFRFGCIVWSVIVILGLLIWAIV